MRGCISDWVKTEAVISHNEKSDLHEYNGRSAPLTFHTAHAHSYEVRAAARKKRRLTLKKTITLCEGDG